MPVFGTASPQTLEAGRPAVVWQNENVVTTSPESGSLSVGLQRNEYFPNCFSAEFKFAADPGAIKVDLQVADTNEEAYFVTKASFETGLNDSFVGRIEATNIVAKFARLKMVTLTNVVQVSARFF